MVARQLHDLVISLHQNLNTRTQWEKISYLFGCSLQQTADVIPGGDVNLKIAVEVRSNL